ncbi:FAD-dependent oxidoreductase [Pseudonocardia benzenivorans]
MPVADRVRVLGAALALGRVDPTDPAVDARTFGDWLAAHGQRPRAVETLWDLVGIATLNARADEASLALAATVFQLGLLTDAAAGDIGWARVPLGRLHDDAARRALRAAGVDVRTSARVRSLTPAPDGWRVAVTRTTARTRRDTQAQAGPAPPDPQERRRSWPTGSCPPCPRRRDPAAAGRRRRPARRLGRAARQFPHRQRARRLRPAGAAPRVRRRRRRPGAVGVRPDGLVGRGVGASAGRAVPGGVAVGGRRPDRAARRRAARPDAPGAGRGAARRRHGPGARLLRDARAARDVPRRPGQAALRPGPVSGLAGLALAGAWTATGWPATMEGAVRSGDAAAAAVLADSGATVAAGAAA